VQKNWRGRRRGNGWEGGTSQGNDGQMYAPFPSKCECWYCQKVGHLAANCPQRLEDEKKKRDMTSVQSANLTIGDLKDLSGCEVGHVYMAATGAPSENDVLLDCGATSHMFRERW
jgi:hypothetical protein